MSNTALAQQQTDFQIISAVISSDRTPVGIDIAKVISDFVIYEHIEKAYLTARFVFYDQENIVQDMDFQGGEKLTLTLQHSEERITGNDIEKVFLIDKIDNIFKVDERNESVVIHCIEYHAFESAAQNISKSYSGAPSKIIKKILDEYLDKELLIDDVDAINDLKVIIPNLDPIEACNWLKKRVLSQSGLPFYLYSALGVNNLVLKSLDKMLTQTPLNLNTPYIYAPSVTSNDAGSQKYYLIENYEYNSGEKLMPLVMEGLVGAEYQFFNTMTGTPTKIHFDVDEDLFSPLVVDNKLGAQNTRYNYAPGYKIKDKPLSQLDSRSITQISSSGAYKQLQGSFKSYNDESASGQHRRKAIGAAVKKFVTKTPLRITVSGREFLTGDENYTIGKTIRVLFLDNTQESGEQRPKYDQKKSGDYIIFATEHIFKTERYDVNLLLGKVASVGEEPIT